MFCTNCGKELKDGDKFCNACGRMVTDGESDNNNTPYVDAVPVDAPGGKKLWSKKLITAISIAAAAVIVFCLIVGAVTAGIGKLTQNHKYEYRRFEDGNGYGNYDIYGGYGGNYGYPSDGSDSGSDKYGRFGNNNGSSESLPFADDPLPTDGNGNSASSPNYQWPSGDGKYEFYAKSTIPKFESVTGNACLGTETDSSDNTYYKYSMDMDAYNKYIDAIEDAGYSQSDFDVQGRDSYMRYENGNQYLDIYLMNSDNQIVIMA